MRNLKKILALVLALVMVIGMMSIATAATPGTSYVDDAAIVNYDEAIQVLDQLGVFRGDEKGNFNPNATITRGEFAAIVYRIVHDDVADKYTGIYADYNKFADVKSTDWNAGYINYCANGEYILGDGAGNFIPEGKVNGYQVLAVMLRALGYDQEGEFQGAGWEVRTARKAKELGITTTVTEGTLGAPATRALVAELVYRSIAKVSTVNYIKLIGYVKTGATLGYEVFGLVGDPQTAIEAAEAGTSVLEATDFSVYTKEMFEAMTVRAIAVPDGKYNEPVAYWYASDLVSLANPAGEIEIRFNPAKTYTTFVSQNEMYALVKGALDAAVFVDGGDAEALDLSYAGTTYGVLPVAQTGRGVVTEVIFADGYAYVVVKNTYVDVVTSPYIANPYGKDYPLTLGEDTFVDYYALYESSGVTAAQWDPIAAMLAGISKGSLVIFNMYEDASVVDFATIHTAAVKNANITDTYVPADAESIDECYFLVAKTKYVYNSNYAQGILLPKYEVLERETLVEAEEENQNLYFDDFGNVVFAAHPVDNTQTGILLLTSSTYGGGSADNGYWNTFKGYDLTGKAVTVKGGLDCFFYGSKDEAQDYGLLSEGYGIGLYAYVIGEDGRYMLTRYENYGDTRDNNDNGLSDIFAGDADAINDGQYLLDDETVFVVANYSAKTGLITGYTVTKGFKNIKDLEDGEYELVNKVDGNEAIPFEVEMVIGDDWTYDGEGYDIDFVFVTGAKQTADKKYTQTKKDVVLVLDETPVKHFTEYDEFSVIKDGKATTVKAVPEFDGFVDGEGYLFEITGYEDDYICEAEFVDGIEGWLVADGVLLADDDFIALADNCKVFDLTTGEMVDVTASAELYLYYMEYYYVAEYNAYGFASVIYVLF